MTSCRLSLCSPDEASSSVRSTCAMRQLIEFTSRIVTPRSANASWKLMQSTTSSYI
jgi:hypothetical protein